MKEKIIVPSCLSISTVSLLVLQNTYSSLDDRQIAVQELKKIAIRADQALEEIKKLKSW